MCINKKESWRDIKDRNCLCNITYPLNRKQNLCAKLMTIRAAAMFQTGEPTGCDMIPHHLVFISARGGQVSPLHPNYSLQISSVKQSFCSLKHRQTSIPLTLLKNENTPRILLLLTISGFKVFLFQHCCITPESFITYYLVLQVFCI